MYVPLKKGSYADEKYRVVGNNAFVKYSYDYTEYDRLRYQHKKKIIYNAITKISEYKEISLVHAHFLFGAGGVANEMLKNDNIKYVVAVRNTDLNMLMKYAIYLRKYILNVIEEASGIVFISPLYKQKMLKKYIPKSMINSFQDKSIIVPNGIDDYWHKNINYRKRLISDTVNLLFVGEYTSNKNILSIISATNILRKKGYNVNLKLIGRGDQEDKINKLVTKYYKYINNKGYIANKEQLVCEYNEADIFIMPSYKETFGLVYIEALSQGLPIVYTKGQGVDGYYKDGEVGYACDPHNINSIVKSVEKIINNYTEISYRCTVSLRKYKWSQICSTYEKLYRDILKKNAFADE